MSSRLAEQIDLEARSSFLKLRKIRAPLIAICLIAFFGVLIYLMIDTISDNQSQLDFKPISGYSAGLLFITIIFFRTVKKHLSLFSKKNNFNGNAATNRVRHYIESKYYNQGMDIRKSITREKISIKEPIPFSEINLV